VNSIRTGSLWTFAVATIILYELAKAPGQPRSTSSSSSVRWPEHRNLPVHLDCCATDHEVHDDGMVGDPHDVVAVSRRC
jgi:hypothetical protein